jgi:hypothetical protein
MLNRNLLYPFSINLRSQIDREQQFQTQHCQQLTQRLRNKPDFPIAASVCVARLNNDRILELQRGGEVITLQSHDPRFESLRWCNQMPRWTFLDEVGQIIGVKLG